MEQKWFSRERFTHPCDDGSSGTTQRHQEEGQQHCPEAHNSNRRLSKHHTDSSERSLLHHAMDPWSPVTHERFRTPPTGWSHSLPLFIRLWPPHPTLPHFLPPSSIPPPCSCLRSPAEASSSSRWQLIGTHTGLLCVCNSSYGKSMEKCTPLDYICMNWRLKNCWILHIRRQNGHRCHEMHQCKAARMKQINIRAITSLLKLPQAESRSGHVKTVVSSIYRWDSIPYFIMGWLPWCHVLWWLSLDCIQHSS